MTEFDLIYKLINTQAISRNDVLTGIGDDCAILSVPENYSLAVSMDTLVAGVHFPESVSAFSIGYKSLAVNLSDLASTGAKPAWVTLSLSMPTADENWITEFVRGLFTLANKYNVQLIGGDTTSGPLSVTIQAHGFVKKPLLRSGAKVGDLIYVSGHVGDASIGLRSYNGENDIDKYFVDKLNQPEPRVDLGLALAEIATSCIDISDGFISDLGHICKQSLCGAEVILEDVPVSSSYKKHFNDQPDYSNAISFGDDYELCFTISSKDSYKVSEISQMLNIQVTCVGNVTDSHTIKFLDKNNKEINLSKKGFEHF